MMTAAATRAVAMMMWSTSSCEEDERSGSNCDYAG